MTSAPPDLRALSGPTRAAADVPRPASRWKTRILLPALILGATAVLLLYAARGVLRPAVEVWVAPVVTKAATNEPGAPDGPAQILVLAPGWVEADPYPVNVAALTEGVIKEVLVLEGQPVEAGQIVARLIDDDARLAVQRAQADLGAMTAELDKARADADSAAARADEVRDEVTRKRDLVDAGGLSAGQYARLELRLKAAEREAQSARAAIALAQANLARSQVALDEARLMLARTEIVSPAAGVVMERLVEPGTRLSMSSRGGGGGDMPGAIVRLYNPQKLQVRSDIPIADAAKVGLGARAQITTEALPDRTFVGRVTRLVHEADIQRNTVQVKVAIENPDPTLKPEMLTRVRFIAGATSTGAPGAAPAASAGGLQLLIPAVALHNVQGSQARVWLVDHSSGPSGPISTERHVTTGATSGDLITITAGLQAGDRVVMDPPQSLKPGARLRILGEKPVNP